MKKLTLDEFINKASLKHNYKYSYHNSIYTNKRTKLFITCPIHGDFEQRAGNHLNGQGCPECKKDTIGKVHKDTLEDFLEKAVKVHKAAYSYNNVQYKGSLIKIAITCAIHGDFMQRPSDHLVGNGCPSCAKNSRTSKLALIDRCMDTHGNTYDYSNIPENVRTKDKVDIICKVHGLFSQKIEDHYSGQGCPKCKTSGFDTSKPAILYFIKLDYQPNLYKIGITNRTVRKRFPAKEFKHMETVLLKYFPRGQECLDMETKLLQQFKSNRPNLDILKSGNTELLVLSANEKDHICHLLTS